MQNNPTTIMCPFCGSDTLVILDGEEGELKWCLVDRLN